MAMNAVVTGMTAGRITSCRRNVRKTGCVLSFLLLAGSAVAQQAPAPTTAPQTQPAETKIVVPPKITYVNGQLKIDAVNVTLGEVLTKVAALLGVTIDVPEPARNEKMPFVDLGPGAPREILASLLGDSNVDFLIQASDADPLKLQSVLVMPREKGGSGNRNDTGGRPNRSPYSRAGASPGKSEETTVNENNSVPAQPEVAVAETNPQPPATQPDQATTQDQATQPDQTAQAPLSIPENSLQIPLAQPGLSKGAMSPPTTLNTQTINQQLQQMYQQRMQMIQQGQPATQTGRQ